MYTLERKLIYGRRPKASNEKPKPASIAKGTTGGNVRGNGRGRVRGRGRGNGRNAPNGRAPAKTVDQMDEEMVDYWAKDKSSNEAAAAATTTAPQGDSNDVGMGEAADEML